MEHQQLPPETRRLSARLAEHFATVDADIELFLVGGLVRDVLLGAPHGRDLDFATSATPRQSERALSRAGGKVFKIGEKFGTIGAVFDIPGAKAWSNSLHAIAWMRMLFRKVQTAVAPT